MNAISWQRPETDETPRTACANRSVAMLPNARCLLVGGVHLFLTQPCTESSHHCNSVTPPFTARCHHHCVIHFVLYFLGTFHPPGLGIFPFRETRRSELVLLYALLTSSSLRISLDGFPLDNCVCACDSVATSHAVAAVASGAAQHRYMERGDGQLSLLTFLDVAPGNAGHNKRTSDSAQQAEWNTRWPPPINEHNNLFVFKSAAATL
ncbi:hypothetical protein CBL_02203 [Carabus blaptoides fortunei]